MEPATGSACVVLTEQVEEKLQKLSAGEENWQQTVVAA